MVIEEDNCIKNDAGLDAKASIKSHNEMRTAKIKRSVSRLIQPITMLRLISKFYFAA
jgi:hypothetical protein